MRRRGRPTAIVRVGVNLLLLLLLLPPASLRGQAPRWEVEAGGARLRYDTLDALNAPSLSGLLEWEGSTFLGRVAAGVTGFQDAGWSLQGRGDLVGWLSPLGEASPFRLELAGAAGASRHSSGFDASQGRVDARVHFLGRGWGGWGGVGGGVARNALDSASVRGLAPNVGAWVREGPARFTVSYLHNVLEGDTWPEVNLSVSVSSGDLDVTAFGGLRSSPFEAEDGESWIGASAAWWLRPGLAVVASGGRYAPDLWQGIPGGDFLSLGVRITPRRTRPVPPEVPYPLIFSKDRADEGGIGFRLPGAEQVAIAGDWNDWRPTPLTRDGTGRWIVPPGVAPGVYRFNLVVDGSRWVVPEDVPEIDDGFGGKVGLLVIARE